MIVIDASAVIELLLRTARGRKIEARVLKPEEQLHAPHLIDIEIAQALRRLVRLEEITAARGKQALEDHRLLHIKRAAHHGMLPRIWQLRDGITAYDSAYVTLAEALEVPLVTCDSKLARSQGHGAKIELVE